jgi:RND family efflux transporter MFP subunit
MTLSRSWTRIALPVVGILITAGLILQVRAARELTSVEPAPHTSNRIAQVIAEGHVSARPGAEVRIGTDLDGVVASMLVKEQDRVQRGQLLASLDTSERLAELAEAEARVREAEADITLHQAQVQRFESLAQSGIVSREEADRPRRDLDAARARKASAEATVRRVEAILARARFYSPIDGIVLHRPLDPGETVASGGEILTVANLDQIWVEAEVDEFDVSRITLGQPAEITAEGFDGRIWQGTVVEIPDQVTSRRLKPQDPGKPVDTRVLLVKVSFTNDGASSADRLKLGQRISISLRSRDGS